jgi:hypothetical protein
MELGEPVDLFWRGVLLSGRTLPPQDVLVYLDTSFAVWFSLDSLRDTLRERLYGPR